MKSCGKKNLAVEFALELKLINNHIVQSSFLQHFPSTFQQESKQNQDLPPSPISVFYTLPLCPVRVVALSYSYQMSLLLLIANRWVMQTSTHTIRTCWTRATCDLSQPRLEKLVSGLVIVLVNIVSRSATNIGELSKLICEISISNFYRCK